MNHDCSVWRLALQALEASAPVALLYVVQSVGSSPGRAGFAMTITADRAAGSIGGGAMEHRFLNQVRRSLGEGPRFLQRQVHDPDAAEDRSGMICSGEQTFCCLPLGSADLPTVRLLLSAGEHTSGGVIALGPGGLDFRPEGRLTVRHRFTGGADWSYEEDWGRRPRLHVVGGGHCALALCQLASGLDFDITVYDDRPELPTFEANTWARRVTVPDYSVMGRLIAAGQDQYVCVMTFGYKTDDVALRSLLVHDYGFLGALGSRAKIDRLLATYSAEGWDPARLRRLQAPLGLPIHSQTPAEIAVSVAAQLIRFKNDPSRSPS